MKLKALVKDCKAKVVGKDVAVTGLATDSRTTSPGQLFIAKKGLSHNGAEFIEQAVKAGAAAVCTDLFDPFLKVTQVIYPDPAALLPILASRYYDHPSKKIPVIGVTGTKGKTTTSYLLRHFLNAGLVGTVETIIGKTRYPSTLTTHDLVQNQKLLREMVQQGCPAAILEVSSHGLEQKRVEGIEFALAVFTNLYPDHLDYHRTMEAYAAAKARLFKVARRAVLNADSPWAEKMGRGVTFGIEAGDIRAEKIEMTPRETKFVVAGTEFVMPLIGKFNVYNALGAIVAGQEMGLSLPHMQKALLSFEGVPGRLERIGNVFVDFAHTQEALENVLATLRVVAKGKLIVVFGAGGDRDPQRRTGLAKAADSGADAAIVTSDNPRREDPQEIARQIVAGFSRLTPMVEIDRKTAIEKAIAMAGPDDFVLIAGKGHQKEQIYAHRTLPFDDVVVAKQALLTVCSKS
jgi:UDP-N-acetylmuramoyl-L-alanyl-D-glutamate--2,6-diaminopimelate ligase